MPLWLWHLGEIISPKPQSRTSKAWSCLPKVCSPGGVWGTSAVSGLVDPADCLVIMATLQMWGGVCAKLGGKPSESTLPACHLHSV